MMNAPERTLSEWWRDAVIAWERNEQPPNGIYEKLDEIAALEQELRLADLTSDALKATNGRLRTAIRGVARHDGWLFWWYEDQPTVKMWIGWMYPRSSA
jgi:hypothetical protein